MNRRSFVKAATAVNSELNAEPARKSRAWFELRFYHPRNDLEREFFYNFVKKNDITLCRVSDLDPIANSDPSTREKNFHFW